MRASNSGVTSIEVRLLIKRMMSPEVNRGEAGSAVVDGLSTSGVVGAGCFCGMDLTCCSVCSSAGLGWGATIFAGLVSVVTCGGSGSTLTGSMSAGKGDSVSSTVRMLLNWYEVMVQGLGMHNNNTITTSGSMLCFSQWAKSLWACQLVWILRVANHQSISELAYYRRGPLSPCKYYVMKALVLIQQILGLQFDVEKFKHHPSRANQ